METKQEERLSVLRGMSEIEKFTGFERRTIIYYIKHEGFPAFLSKGGRFGVYMANPKKIVEWWDNFDGKRDSNRQNIG